MLNTAFASPRTGANARQIGGAHYKKTKGLEHWDVCETYGVGYLESAGSKYLTRVKNGVEDVEKAGHYVEKLIELHGTIGRIARGIVPMEVCIQFALDNSLDARRAAVCTLLFRWTSVDDLEQAAVLIREIATEMGRAVSLGEGATILPFPGNTSVAASDDDAVLRAVAVERGQEPVAALPVEHVLRYEDTGNGEPVARRVPIQTARHPVIPRRPSTMGLRDYDALSYAERTAYSFDPIAGEYVLNPR